jgi:protein TonB
MPRDLFGTVIDLSARPTAPKWPTVSLSFIAHATALVMLLVIPLMATGALPMPKSGATVIAILPPPLPTPPPATLTKVQKPAANENTVPVITPDGIPPEPDLATGFEETTEPVIGIVDGIGERIKTAIVEPSPAPPPAVQKPVHVGGLIKQPAKTHDAAPAYPAIALAARKEGVVIIEATIGVDGRVQDARILRSESLLDQAALDAVRQWIYTPTTLNGVPVPVIMTVTVRFTLQR